MPNALQEKCIKCNNFYNGHRTCIPFSTGHKRNQNFPHATTIHRLSSMETVAQPRVSRKMCFKKSKWVTDILERFLRPFTFLYPIESGCL